MLINDNLVHAILVALLKEMPEPRAQAIVDEWRAGTEAGTTAQATMYEHMLDTQVCELDLSVRAERVLHEHGIETVRQLVKVSPREMRRWPQIGRKTILEVRELLQNLGLDLRGGDDETST